MSSPATGRAPRAPRADALRNRKHILAVAADSFASDGIDVSMDAIAKRAGIGAGTLYRHFPSREDLVAGVLADHQPDLERERAAAEQEPDSRRALEQWLGAVSAWMRAYQGLAEPLRAALTRDASPLAPACDEVIATTDRFLQAAQRDGHARPEVRGHDLYLGTLAAAWATGTTSADDQVGDGVTAMLRSGWSTR